jgi:hypothetical protein
VSAAGAGSPAHLRIVNAAQGPDTLQLQLCATGGDCRELDAGQGTVGPSVTLTAGVYSIVVAAAGRELDRFDLGLGHGERYALLLYGLAERPVDRTTTARLKRLLGGTDERIVDGYQLAHRVVVVSPEPGANRAKLRLANLAPGAKPLGMRAQSGVEETAFAPVAYGGVGPAEDVPAGAAELLLKLPEASTASASLATDLPRGSVTLVVVCALEGGAAQVVLDQRMPGAAN